MTSISFGQENSGFQVGVNQGSIYLQSERSEPRPEPLSTVPFPHNPDFVGRNEILDQIHEKSSIKGSRVALIGLGGVGKTQLAIEYCHRVRKESADTWVFWVHASNAARCKESLRDLADRLKIPGRHDRNANIFRVVANWLQDEKIGKWILVLDNVDDDELLRNPPATTGGMETHENTQSHASTQPPLRYLLEILNGSIIITSRNKSVASEIASHKKNVIDVQPMNMAEALALLQNKLDMPVHTDSVDMERLVEKLDFIPLAIIQAASYIFHRSPRCSVSQYLEQLRKSDRQATKLLNYEADLIYRDWEAKNSILVTWQISFDHIRQTRQSAADLLSLMSFFDYQGIPEKLLRSQDRERNHDNLSSAQEVASISSEEDTDSSSESDLDHAFEDDIATLREYSFVYTSGDSAVFTMHRLVQLTARAWLTTQGQIERWKEQFIRNLCREFPDGDFGNWTVCEQLFPHAKLAILQRPESQSSRLEWATLLLRGAWYASERGNILDAREMALKSRKQRVVSFGVDGSETLESTSMLARVHYLDGRWEEAEKLFVQATEMYKTGFGECHSDTLNCMSGLASTYWKQARYKEAEQLQLQVIEARKAKLGEDHPDILESIGNLAAIYCSQGQYKEAEQLELHVMEARKAKLGEGHPDTLLSIGNLAFNYCLQGRYNEAEQLELQAREVRTTMLGKYHPDTLSSMKHLAAIYICQGRYKEAEQLNLQVMRVRKTTLGDDHPDTLSIMASLASTYYCQGRYNEAEQLDVHVIERYRLILGEDHRDTLSTMADLSFTLQSTGRHVQAIDLLRKCVLKQQQILGPAHPETQSNSDTLLKWETSNLAITTST